MNTKLFGIAAALASLVAMSSAPALASTVVFSLSAAAVGNQPTSDEPLDLGMDFTVNKSGVTVDSLGAFTNGLYSVLVTLYNVTTGTATIVAQTTVGPGLPVSNYLFSPISLTTLTSGDTYQINAVYTADNLDYNPYESYVGPKPSVVFNSLGGALTFAGDYYSFGDTGAVATTYDSLSTNGYGAGSFAVTPLPSTWSMLLIGFIGLGFVAYRGGRNSPAACPAV